MFHLLRKFHFHLDILQFHHKKHRKMFINCALSAIDPSTDHMQIEDLNFRNISFSPIYLLGICLCQTCLTRLTKPDFSFLWWQWGHNYTVLGKSSYFVSLSRDQWKIIISVNSQSLSMHFITLIICGSKHYAVNHQSWQLKSYKFVIWSHLVCSISIVQPILRLLPKVLCILW